MTVKGFIKNSDVESVFNVTHPIRIKEEDFDFVKDRTVAIFWRNKDGELIGTPCRLSRFFISILEKNGFVEKKEEEGGIEHGRIQNSI